MIADPRFPPTCHREVRRVPVRRNTKPQMIIMLDLWVGCVMLGSKVTASKSLPWPIQRIRYSREVWHLLRYTYVEGWISAFELAKHCPVSTNGESHALQIQSIKPSDHFKFFNGIKQHLHHNTEYNTGCNRRLTGFRFMPAAHKWMWWDSKLFVLSILDLLIVFAHTKWIEDR